MEIFPIIIIVICTLSLYVRLRLTESTRLDKILSLVTGVVLLQTIHIYIVNTYFPNSLYLDALLPYRLLYPPLIYFTVKLSSQKERGGLEKYIIFHLIPIFIFLLIFVILSFSQILRDLYGVFIFKMLLLVEITSIFFYSIWSVLILYKSQKSDRRQSRMRIAIEIAIMLMVLKGSFSLIRFFEFLYKEDIVLDRHGQYSLIFLLLLAVLLYVITMEKEIISDNSKVVRHNKDHSYSIPPIEVTKKVENHLIDSHDNSHDSFIDHAEEVNVLLQKLQDLTDANWFLNSTIDLQTLANATHTSPALISEVLNLKLGVNFNTYVNNIRIKYVVDALKEQVKDDQILSIEELYIQAGFNSKSTFNRHFKRVMGQTPRKFISTIRN